MYRSSGQALVDRSFDLAAEFAGKLNFYAVLADDVSAARLPQGNCPHPCMRHK